MTPTFIFLLFVIGAIVWAYSTFILVPTARFIYKVFFKKKVEEFKRQVENLEDDE